MGALSSTTSIRAMLVHGGQQQGERAAFADLAIYPDLASVRGHDKLHEGKSQARPGHGVPLRRLPTHELLENVRPFGIWDTDPPIADANRGVTVFRADA